jgi:hypothetical protein
MSSLPAPPLPGPVAAGQICDPDNISSADQSTAAKNSLVCQLTDVTETVMMPAEFQNALKGDVILSPGGTSTISQLFRAMSPPQYHAHSGIMSKNFIEITHCTASEDRLADYTQGVGGSGGIQPDVLTYLWPGSVTQSVTAAVAGENWIDPDGKSYNISGFTPEAIGNTDNDDFVITPPLVLKPNPESAAIRTKLQTVAEYARARGGQVDNTGKITTKPGAHYRFYCYTKPQIALTTPAPASAGWAAGTIPCVCSSFVWYCMHQNGVHFDTSQQFVTAGDLPAGVPVGPSELDGLFYYPEAERQAGGVVLDSIFQTQISDIAGVLGEIASFFGWDIAADIADQILNTFAFDNAASGYGSNAWQNPGDGNAISPDNIQMWKAPPLGVLGYAEPLQFLDAHPEQYTVSRWIKVVTFGSVSGKVTVGGQPVNNAYVYLYDGMDAYTDSTGAYSMKKVGVGSYKVTAQAVYNGYEYTASQQIKIDAANPNLTVNLVLDPPSDVFRRLNILYTWSGEYSPLVGSSSYSNVGPDQQSIPLSPGQVANSLGITCVNPGNFSVTYQFNATLAEDLSIQIDMTPSLYDSGGGLEVQGPMSTYNVPKNGEAAGGWNGIYYHSGWGWTNGPSNFSFTASNAQDG